MLYILVLSVLQAATEFLPVSSSGHLALLSNIIAEPDIAFITVLHAASALAVIVFNRREIRSLCRLTPESKQMWRYLIIATIPAALFGILGKQFIESAFTSYYALGIALTLSGIVLFTTRYARPSGGLTLKRALIIGICQAFALFPGVTRSGMTISSGLLSGLEREQAFRFSFLLFIPLAFGAMLTESGGFQGDIQYGIAFAVCFALSLLFLNLLLRIVRQGRLWLFSFYCFTMSLVSFLLHFKILSF